MDVPAAFRQVEVELSVSGNVGEVVPFASSCSAISLVVIVISYVVDSLYMPVAVWACVDLGTQVHMGCGVIGIWLGRS